MAELNKLNLTPRPIYPEPSSSSAALPDGASPSTFDVGSGSEVASDRFELLTDEARNRMNYIADTSAPVADESRYRLHDLRERLNQKLPIMPAPSLVTPQFRWTRKRGVPRSKPSSPQPALVSSSGHP